MITIYKSENLDVPELDHFNRREKFRHNVL